MQTSFKTIKSTVSVLWSFFFVSFFHWINFTVNSINLCHQKLSNFICEFIFIQAIREWQFILCCKKLLWTFFDPRCFLPWIACKTEVLLYSFIFENSVEVVFFGLNFFWMSLLRRPQTKQSLSASFRCVQKLQVKARCLSLAAKVEILSPFGWMQFWNQDRSVITSFFIVEWPLRTVARSLFTLLDKYLPL